MTVDAPRHPTAADAFPGDPDLVALARTGTVHFVGIAGAGMSALAEYLLRAGGSVSGCDARPGETGAHLAALGASVQTGHDAAHAADVVALVATAAVRADHPELAAARERGIPVLKRAHALATIVNRGTLAAVAGTHGKTTTSAMLAQVLERAQLRPTAFVGGRVPGWSGGLLPGGDTLFVAEADEFDHSFLWLRPDHAVVTSVEADHLDIYGGLDQLVAAFAEFIALLPPNGLLAVCADEPNAARLGEDHPHRITYGTSADAMLRAVRVEPAGRGSRFDVVENGRVVATLEVAAPGLHNVGNALGAWALARELGADLDAAASALASFTGVDRRFQEIGDAQGVTFIDDYAHHPTEIAATLAAARLAFPGRRLVAVFQPHLYTRTRDFAEAFGASLTEADTIVVMDVYAAREQPIAGITGATIVTAARNAGGREVHYAPTPDDLMATLEAVLESGDVCVAMGAGDIDQAVRRVCAQRRAT